MNTMEMFGCPIASSYSQRTYFDGAWRENVTIFIRNIKIEQCVANEISCWESLKMLEKACSDLVLSKT